MSDSGYTGFQQTTSPGSDLNAQTFLITQIMNRMATTTLVKVVAVTNSGGISPVGFVDVQPMVHQVDGAGKIVPHGVISNLPYFRVQGGTDAIILDPKVGDIGIASFCHRDTSVVKSTKAPAGPGSQRKFDWADGVYWGGVLNGTPTQYVAFATTGITIVSPMKVTITAPLAEVVSVTQVTVTSPIVKVNGNLQVTGTVTGGFGGGDSVGLQTHRHGTGTNAAGTTVPTPGL